MRGLFVRTIIGLLAVPIAAIAQPAPFRIAVMDDMSGIYKDIQGPGDTVAAQMAVDDYGGKVLGRRIELLSGDLQNKVDVGVSLARKWYDEDGVSAIFGLGNSAVALAVQQVARDKQRIDIVTSAGTTDLTGKQCSPFGVQWTYDTYALAKGTASAVSAAGGKDWYFITADYAFGHSLEENAAHFVQATGGKVLGNSLTPLGTADYSQYLLQAQSAKASVIGIAAAGADMVNVIKQMSEFGLMKSGVRAAGLLTLITDIHAIGLDTAQGLYFTEAFYWDQNDQTRAFSSRFAKLFGKPPTSFQASIYGAVMHYLKAVQAVGQDDAAKVMAQMRATPINDFMTHDGVLRPDGRVVRDMYLLKAKTPGESKGEWDLAVIAATIPGDQAFRPMSEGGCPLVQGQ
jgi:branched-chain amino acid transport system substrate-binding protein